MYNTNVDLLNVAKNPPWLDHGGSHIKSTHERNHVKSPHDMIIMTFLLTRIWESNRLLWIISGSNYRFVCMRALVRFEKSCLKISRKTTKMNRDRSAVPHWK